ncbi:phosphate/phosphite/phosphonate ABC transporter substrate-binding protein [bacterium]|nr:phosphate/phosphite/phosphonate ABC transporter substrate-binding protein [bacterium]
MRRKRLVIGAVVVFLIFLSSAAFIMGRSSLAKIYVDKGDKYFELDELDKAMVEFKKAVRIDPKLTKAHLALAEIYIREDMLDEAIEELLEAAELQPDRQEIRTRLKQVYDRGRSRGTKLLRFGIQPSLGPLTSVELMQPLVNYLSKKLDMNVVLVLFPDYASIVEYLKTNQIDIVALGPIEYIKAQQEAEVVPIVAPTIQGQAVQKSVIITRRDSGIEALSDLKGKTFAFVDKNSALGYLIPRILLMQNGINPVRDLKGIFFTGSDDKVFHSVLDKKVNAGAMARHLYQYLSTSNKRRSEITILAESQEIPQGPFVARKGLNEELTKRLRDLLINLYLSHEGRKILRYGQIFDGYIKAVETEDKVKDFKGYTFPLTEF